MYTRTYIHSQALVNPVRWMQSSNQIIHPGRLEARDQLTALTLLVMCTISATCSLLERKTHTVHSVRGGLEKLNRECQPQFSLSFIVHERVSLEYCSYMLPVPQQISPWIRRPEAMTLFTVRTKLEIPVFPEACLQNFPEKGMGIVCFSHAFPAEIKSHHVTNELSLRQVDLPRDKMRIIWHIRECSL